MEEIKRIVDEINKGEIDTVTLVELGPDWPMYYETVKGVTSIQICDAEDMSAQSVLDIEPGTLTEEQLNKMIEDFAKLI